MVEFYLLTFPRFPLRKKEHKSYFGKNRTHDFRTSRCAAYLLGHSGDERLEKEIYISSTCYLKIEETLKQAGGSRDTHAPLADGHGGSTQYRSINNKKSKWCERCKSV